MIEIKCSELKSYEATSVDEILDKIKADLLLMQCEMPDGIKIHFLAQLIGC